MQIKTAVRYHFIPIRMATIKKKKITSLSEDVGENGTSALLVEV